MNLEFPFWSLSTDQVLQQTHSPIAGLSRAVLHEREMVDFTALLIAGMNSRKGERPFAPTRGKLATHARSRLQGERN
ncbi:MAG TPA: hypothetical protein V6C57_21660 [Coleofasciculaceae cyanobacterium]